MLGASSYIHYLEIKTREITSPKRHDALHWDIFGNV